ncbi:hypothetical protein [Streptomyces sp. NPDC005573]|uniref:hypothetical protein n=1 Tax=Streptomyces sp. NPDC005573 TaxID=3156890 RepID=UPI0033A6BCC7
MADSNSVDTSGGFSNTDDGVIATSAGDTTGDYSHWNWKLIMAAITGGAANADDSSITYPSDPQTVQDAANTLYYTQQVLQEVGQAITDQTNALTGENGPWQGPAAQALDSAMRGVAKQTQAMADVLSGGVTGDENVPQQLANNAQHLREALAKIEDINNWYAQQALKIKPSALMSNGLVAVSQVPPIPDMMADDMRQVLTTLAGHYEMSKDSVAQPTSPTNPNNIGPDSGTPDNGGYGYSYGPNAPVPYYDNPYYGDQPDPYGTGSNPYGMELYNPYGTGNNGPYGTGGDPYGAGGDPSQIPKFQNDGPGLGENVPGFATNAPKFMSVAPPGFSPDSGDSASQIPKFQNDDPGLGENAPGFATNTPKFKSVAPLGFSPDSETLGGPLSNAALKSPAPFPGEDSTDLPPGGKFDPAMDAALNPADSKAGINVPVASFPNLSLGGDSAASPNSSKSATKVSPYTGGKGLDSPAGGLSGPSAHAIAPYKDMALNTPGAGAAFPGGLSSPSKYSGTGGTGLGSGMPALRNLSADGPSAKNAVTGYPGAGAGAGGPVAGEMPNGSGMPMMPMGMGAGGAGAGGGQGGPSDASGLLSGDAAPWKGLPSDGLGEVTGGAAAGGPGLSLPGGDAMADEPSSGDTPSEVAPAESGPPMMPMMPMGMGGMGAGGTGGGSSEQAPSDASGLLSGDSAPWVGSSAESDGLDGFTGGANAGGPGLSTPDAESVAGEPALGMPLMPMGGTNSGNDSEHEHSDASGLLFGAAEPWAAAPDAHVQPVGSPHGAVSGEGRLTLPQDDALAADLFSGHGHDSTPGQESQAGSAVAEEAAAAMLAWAPFLAAAGASEGSAGGHAHSADTSIRATEGAPGPAWGEATWGPSGTQWGTPGPVAGSGAPGGAAYGVDPAAHSAQPGVPAQDPGPVETRGEEFHLPRHEAVSAASGVLAESFEPEPAEGAPAPEALAADDAATWDSTAGSLLPLLGPDRGTAEAAGTAVSDIDRQDAAAATAVAAGASAIARAATAEQGFTEPTRVAWRPKASGPASVELSCSFSDPEPASEPETGPRANAAVVAKDRGEAGEDGKNSIADLLRQGEEAWG